MRVNVAECEIVFWTINLRKPTQITSKSTKKKVRLEKNENMQTTKKKENKNAFD